MQLNPNLSVRRALAAATCTLLGSAAQTSQAESADDPWRLDTSVLYYSEQNRVTVIEPVVFLRKAIGEDSFLNFRLIYDTMTGASANGATPTDKPQTFTSPSGTTSYTTPTGQTPLSPFHDQRIALAAEWDKPVDRMSRTIYGINASTETDYTSVGLSAKWLQDLNDRLTTLTAGIAGSYDIVSPVGGAPTPMQLMSTVVPPPPGSESEGEGGSGKTKIVTDTIIGVTQVLSRRALMQFNYSIGYSSGYLTDPYKVVSVIDSTSGATLDYRYESRPDTRLRQSFFWETVYHFNQDVVHFSYRYFWDDWGIRANTAELHYRWELGKGSYLQPHLRYSVQSAANFYVYNLVNTDPVPAYASADYRLGDLTTTTVGLKFGMPVTPRSEVSLRVESITQSGNGSPSSAIGIQKNYDLFPTIKTAVAQITYTGRF
jgi:hypothetical protein